MTFNADKTVREIAIENPATVRIFESLGIDYCCGGRRPLGEACEAAHVPLARAMELLEDAGRHAGPEPDVWASASLAALAEHIVQHHHEFVRQESPRLEALLDKVVSRHGDTHPELKAIQELFTALSQELTAHMMKEERVLFPHIEQTEAAVRSGAALPPSCFGSVEMPISRMLAEHDDAGELTAQIRKLSGDFHPPAGACPTYHALFQGLGEFELDLHRHIHLENNVLFPRAVAMERSVLEATR